jgi:hypothetical protein
MIEADLPQHFGALLHAVRIELVVLLQIPFPEDAVDVLFEIIRAGDHCFAGVYGVYGKFKEGFIVDIIRTIETHHILAHSKVEATTPVPIVDRMEALALPLEERAVAFGVHHLHPLVELEVLLTPKMTEVDLPISNANRITAETFNDPFMNGISPFKVDGISDLHSTQGLGSLYRI